MAEFLPIDAEDLVEEVVEEYSYSAGRAFGRTLLWLFFFSLFGFVSFGRTIGVASLPGEQINGADGIRGLGIFVAIVLTISAGGWLWTDVISKRQTGSRINPIQRKVFWWNGKVPAGIHAADIDALTRVTFKSTGEDSEDVFLWDQPDHPVTVPGRCFRDTRKWAKTLKS